MSHHHELLTPTEMAQVDQRAIEQGISGFRLMEKAGQAVVAVILDRWTPRPVRILCGPGNNGGDGFVVARLLREHGWPVRLGLLGSLSHLRGETRDHAALWAGEVESPTVQFLDGAGLVVDAMFGTGLSRPLDGLALQVVQHLSQHRVPVCAIDIPTGIDGRTGQILGVGLQADVTVTFHRKKPGQLLLPGRVCCGELVVADIGIPDSVVHDHTTRTYENHPDVWMAQFPWPQLHQHKYQRGHVLVRGGDIMTGAARLSALAAARAGAGLVSVATSSASWPIYAASLLSTMVVPCDDVDAWRVLLSDPRRNVVVMGPGAGVSDSLADEVLSALNTKRAVVLDADALTVFAHHGMTLFQAIKGPCILTPHSGEFTRLFGKTNGDRLQQARDAAQISGAVIVLKGADTVIAAADGRAVINTNAPPDLATGGTGDVLTGIMAGLVAQGMESFNAAAAAVWVHGRAATLFGPGLIADDLPLAITQVLRELKEHPLKRDSALFSNQV